MNAQDNKLPASAGHAEALSQPSAADLAIARNVANSPKTNGQQLLDSWKADPDSHPATRVGGTMKQ